MLAPRQIRIPSTSLTRKVPIIYPVLITAIVTVPLCFFFITAPSVSFNSLRNQHVVQQDKNSDVSLSNPVTVDADIGKLQANFDTWLNHLRRTGGKQGVTTERIGCRELEVKAQTCTFEGMMCMDVSTQSLDELRRARVYFVDDRQPDNTVVPADDWCYLRHQSSDPRYYSSRQWPPLENTIIPQQSCMDAWYRTSQSLFASNPRIKWTKSLAMIDHDFFENDHNGHLTSDTMWMLDASLFQESLSFPRKRPGHTVHRAEGDEDGLIWRPDFTLYLPHKKEQFLRQMNRDVNRLLYSLILRKDARKLYPNLTDEQLHTPPDPSVQRETARMFEAFPELNRESNIMFHSDLIMDKNTDLVCTPRLTSGFKTGFSIHERTCRHLRTKTYELYGIPRAPMVRIGQVAFPQPPKSVLILDRHQNRRIANAKELHEGLKKRLEPYGVEVSYVTTEHVQTAEQFARIYSSAGIIISPHGSQNFGQMWMQRYAALIEIMPVGYTEYSFHMQSLGCKIWFYEFHSSAIEKDRAKYEEKCGDKKPHMFSPCTEYKSEDVWVKVDKIMPTILHALERLGYHTGSIWFEDIYPLNNTSPAK